MSIQDRNKDTAGPQARRLDRRAFIDTSVRVAAGIAATPLLLAAEPVIGVLGLGKPVEAAVERGTEKTQDAIPPLIFVTHRNPDDPEATAKWLEQRERVDTYFRQVLTKMRDSGIPEFEQDYRDYIELNGKPPQPTLGIYTEKQFLDIVMPSDPNQRSKVSFIVLEPGFENTKPQYDNIFLIVANNINGDNDPGNIQPALNFHEVMVISRLMKETIKSFPGSAEELITLLKQEKSSRDKISTKDALDIYKRAKTTDIVGTVYADSDYYSKLAQVSQADEIVVPETSSDAAVTESVEPSNNASAGDYPEAKDESTP